MIKDYDLVIIGGGAAGFSAAVRYSELTGGESRIALINHGPLGGTCVNVGCIPSKRLLYIAKEIHGLRSIDIPGVEIDPTTLDIKRIMENVRNLVKYMRRGKYEDLLTKFDNIDHIIGKAYFRSPHEVVVEDIDELIIRGRKILIATGSRPAIPDIPGLESVEYHTSDSIWSLDRDIDSMLIVGAGPIGLELAQAFSRLGVKVSIVEVLDRIIPATEPEISDELREILVDEGIDIRLGSRITRVDKRNGYIEAWVSHDDKVRRVTADILLIATGRRPNTDGLLLEKAGVKVDEVGRVIVDRHLKTGNPDIYAAGDVSSTSKPALLETISAREGAIAAENIVYGDKTSVDHSHIPVAVFTDPEVGFVGVREVDVIKEVGACQCRLVSFSSLAKAGVIGMEKGVAKLIVDPHTGVVKGFHVLAPNASEFIAEAALMIRHGYKIGDVINSPSVFPTASEIIKVSAQAFIRDIGRMPCCME